MFADANETVPVNITDISADGVRLILERLQFGPYHLLIGEELPRCELTIQLPEGSITSRVLFHWYKHHTEGHFFEAGVSFVDMTRESRTVLSRIIRQLSRFP